MKSMTGFGSAQLTDASASVTFRAELSSINRKQFELKCALPHEVAIYENKLRILLGGMLSRGSILLRVEIVSNNSSATGANLAAARRYADIFRELETVFGSRETLAAAMSVPSVADAVFGQSSILPDSTESLLYDTVRSAAENLIAMREAEGGRLQADLNSRVAMLEHTLEEIEPSAAGLAAQLYEKLLGRVREAGYLADPSDERFLRELVIFTDKCDVTEEIVRLKSHFTHFRATMNQTTEPAGRPLDFITQEIFREVNTLGNKAPVPEISRRIVAMKTEVEKIREQVQNIE